MYIQSFEEKENGTAVMNVVLTAEELDRAVRAQFEAKKDQYEVKGYEKGQAPFEKVLEVYGETALYQNVINAMAGPVYQFGLKETGVRVIGRPTFQNVSVTEKKEMVFTFSVMLYPEVTLGQYRGLKAKKETAPVTEEDIGRAIEEEQAKNVRTVDVEGRPAREGDTVIIDFEGFLGGTPFDGGRGDAYPLELGSHSFVPGFEEQVAGMMPGETRDIDITFPQNYVPDLAGKAVVFKVKLHRITRQEKVPVEITDAYREAVRTALERKAAQDALDNFHKAILSKAAENLIVTLPEGLVEENGEAMVRDYASRMGIDGRTPFDQVCQMMGIDDSLLKETIYPTAEEQIRLDLLIKAVIEAEKIAAEKEAIEEFASRMALSYGVTPDEVRQRYDDEALQRLCSKELAMMAILESALEE
ncbi:MAG: trigger factor [Lachnospiraceae bacterium]|nr:trigger factor [Lachnospiraceae bacterium]